MDAIIAAQFAAQNKCTSAACVNVKSREYNATLCDNCIQKAWDMRARIAAKIASSFERFCDVKETGVGVKSPWLTAKEFDTVALVSVQNRPVVGFFVHGRYDRLSVHAVRKGFNGDTKHWRYELQPGSDHGLFKFMFDAEKVFPQLKGHWEAP